MTTDLIWFLIFIFICHLNGQRVNIWSEPLLNGANLSDFDWSTGSLVSNTSECPSGSSCYELKKDRQLGIWLSTIGYHSVQLIYSIRSYGTGDSAQDYCQLWYTAGTYTNDWDDWTLIHSTSATISPIIESIDFSEADNSEYFAFDFHAWKINLGDRCWINYLNLTGIPIPTTMEPTMEPTVNPTMKSTEIESTNTEHTGFHHNNASNTSSIMITRTTTSSIKSTQIVSTNNGQMITSDITLKAISTAISTLDGVDISNKSQLIDGINDIIIYIVIGLFICCCCICIGFILLYRKRVVQHRKYGMQNEIKMSTPMPSIEKRSGKVGLGSNLEENSNLNEEDEANDVVVIQIKQTKMCDNQSLNFIDYHENEGKNMNIKLIKYVDNESDNDDELYLEQEIDVNPHKITVGTDDGNITQQNEVSMSSDSMKNNDIYTTTRMQHVVSGEGIVKY